MFKQVCVGSEVLDLYFTDEPGVFLGVRHKKGYEQPIAYENIFGEPVARYTNDEVLEISQEELFAIITGGVKI
jgi:hypothetical protein